MSDLSRPKKPKPGGLAFLAQPLLAWDRRAARPSQDPAKILIERCRSP